MSTAMKKIKAINSIRIGIGGVSHRYAPGSVFEVDGGTAEMLIHEKYAIEARSSDPETPPELKQETTEDLLEEVASSKGKRRKP